MAQSPPPPPQTPPTWYPATGPQLTPELVVLAIAIAAILVLVFVMFAFLFGGMQGTMFLGFLCIPILFIIFIFVMTFARFFRRRTIPPPPPIQRPMVPAGQQGPVALDCPNCGGPPTNVDRFGIAVCAYCGTRFLIR